MSVPPFPEFKTRLQQFQLEVQNSPHAYFAESFAKYKGAAVLAFVTVIVLGAEFFNELDENKVEAFAWLALALIFVGVFIHDLRQIARLEKLQALVIADFDRLREAGALDPVAEFRKLGGMYAFRQRYEAEQKSQAAAAAEDEAIERAKAR